MQDSEFLADISPLLAGGYAWEPEAEASIVFVKTDRAFARRSLERQGLTGGLVVRA
jgi:hypothetical protein